VQYTTNDTKSHKPNPASTHDNQANIGMAFGYDDDASCDHQKEACEYERSQIIMKDVNATVVATGCPLSQGGSADKRSDLLDDGTHNAYTPDSTDELPDGHSHTLERRGYALSAMSNDSTSAKPMLWSRLLGQVVR
jgi:hypothetical protein